ncbi:hypothetical protein Poli38472_008272 [Pythium oligandrum]|uniref:Uncharacterized protein n=1 Tax=Pythium oligandrum TaxID=41045 RepID=A0A8K1CN36_PYTOL|nr:hypothetical protein Poli38472_008272 [Pythium oligandrum]|eukprot:TMW65630.1 hypothetical protein Poli38472_008272 [Pythium oligandrum]
MMMRGLVCDFVLDDGCEHPEHRLFAAEYKRSNRSRAAKIVRCFPHCCPDHRGRSYCGSPLHVKITLDTDEGEPTLEEQSRLSGDLFVFGRFEEEEPSADDESLQYGQRIHRDEIVERDLAPHAVIWHPAEEIVGGGQELSSTNAESKRVFTLTGSGNGPFHWEYNWNSGTSKRARATLHHFRVYVFAPVAQRGRRATAKNTMWEVVGIATSPTFVFTVYRKHHDIANRMVYDMMEDEEELHEDEVEFEDEEETDDPMESLETDTQFVSSPVVDQGVLWHIQQRATVRRSTSFAILIRFGQMTDASWLSQHRNMMLELLSSYDAAPEHVLLHYVAHCVPSLVNALSPRICKASTQYPWLQRFSESKWERTTNLFGRVLCYIFTFERWNQLRAIVVAQACAALEDVQMQDVFVQWVASIGEEIDLFLRTQGTSLDAFSDDIVTAVLTEYQSDEDGDHDEDVQQMRQLLRNTSALGLYSFRDHLRRLRTHEQVSTPPRIDREDDENPPKWQGKWICRRISSSPCVKASIRRHSWPVKASDDANSSAQGTPGLGLLPVMLTSMVAFGLELQYETKDKEDADQRLEIRGLASPVGDIIARIRLDGIYQSLEDVVSPEWFAVFQMINGDDVTAWTARGKTSDEGFEVDLVSSVAGRQWVFAFHTEGVGDSPHRSSSAFVLSRQQQLRVSVRLDEALEASISSNNGAKEAHETQWEPRTRFAMSYCKVSSH